MCVVPTHTPFALLHAISPFLGYEPRRFPWTVEMIQTVRRAKYASRDRFRVSLPTGQQNGLSGVERPPCVLHTENATRAGRRAFSLGRRSMPASDDKACKHIDEALEQAGWKVQGYKNVSTYSSSKTTPSNLLIIAPIPTSSRRKSSTTSKQPWSNFD